VKRSTWGAVLVTAVVLIGAGNLPRLPWERAAATWSAALDRTIASWSHARPPAHPQIPKPPRLPALPTLRAMPNLPAFAAFPGLSDLSRLLAFRDPVRSRAPIARSLQAHAAPGSGPRPAAPSLLVSRPEGPSRPRLGFPSEALAHAGAGALGGLATLALIAFALRRNPRARVYRMARNGHAAERIARRTHVPQDAVRTLLTPGLGARR
jgi:hypothetical protein